MVGNGLLVGKIVMVAYRVMLGKGSLWGPWVAFYHDREQLLPAEVWVSKRSPDVLSRVVVNASAMRECSCLRCLVHIDRARCHGEGIHTAFLICIE